MSPPPPSPSPFSSLASKPPQNPASNPTRPPPLRSPSSHNYAAALAAAKLRAAHSPASPGLYTPLGKRGGTASVPSACANGATSTAAASTPVSAGDAKGSPANTTSTASAPMPVKLTTSTGKHTGTITPPVGRAVDVCVGSREGEGEGEGEGEKGARPGAERMQSWSEQDMKRVMQERLLRGEGAGFSKGRG